MTDIQLAEVTLETENSRTKRLKAATNSAHSRLDSRIMQAKPFVDRDRYRGFLKMQYMFHRDLDALFFDPQLDAIVPDLASRCRLAMIEQDFADLGMSIPVLDEHPHFLMGQELTLPQGLGWLYVIEGSNLGAAFLLKYAAQIGLDEGFGARHLAGAPEGRGLHWRTFKAALDSVDLTEEEEQIAVSSAELAFNRVYSIAESVF